MAARARRSGRRKTFQADLLLIAAGRAPTTGVLNAPAGSVALDRKGWIRVDERLRTTARGVWAVGDATGRDQFKHKANHDSYVVYQNALLGRRVRADYQAVPHAVFTDPEVAAVGLGEAEAVRRHGVDDVLIGFHRFQDTAKGEILGSKDHFVKLLVRRETLRILGAHIVGPHASILIQEVINVMNSDDGSVRTIDRAMHIHPALSEVVGRAVESLGPVREYRRHVASVLPRSPRGDRRGRT